MLDKREEALRNRHQRLQEAWSEHTRYLPPLKVGDLVRIQNQVGNKPRRWDRTGVVVEVKQNDQYFVNMDGSNRATLRNRRFLRRYEPMFPTRSTKETLSQRIKALPELRFHPRSIGIPNKPLNDHHEPQSEIRQHVSTDPPVITARASKRPLALRRLDNFNKKGLKED